jgi:hypothetical protein
VNEVENVRTRIGAADLRRIQDGLRDFMNGERDSVVKVIGPELR